MVRRTGWGGELPASDAEAVARIIGATRRVIDSEGAGVSITHVAQELQVTRQTVYRYFPSLQALLQAVALDAAEAVLPGILDQVRTAHDAVGIVIELLTSGIEVLTTDRVLVFLLGQGASTGLLGGSMTGPVARAHTKAILDRVDIDWRALGFDDQQLDQLIEWCLIVMSAYLQRPADEISPPDQLRAYLTRWLAPSIEAVRNGPDRNGDGPDRLPLVESER
ncbi:TetR/AcrR family transcriptional regulator [Gordonia sp. CPCC 206044]|uniref:TetR/AcrR family transcriptional regulator n=1 Tax=Gordonia sp. CPCC 206044 TaxID=3140793 RepID=UPI003AF36D72